MTLKEKIEKYNLTLFGNRASTLGRIMWISGLVLMTDSIIEYGPKEAMDQSNFIINYFAMLAGGGIDALTLCGSSTPHYFETTEESIKEHGTLEERFAKTLIEGSDNGRFIGYCQQQGMYLAAKKHGFKKEAKQYLKEYSRVKFPFF